MLIQALVHTTCGVLIPDDMFDACKKRWIGKHGPSPLCILDHTPNVPAAQITTLVLRQEEKLRANYEQLPHHALVETLVCKQTEFKDMKRN